MKILVLVSVSVADMLVQIYRYRQIYRLGKYIGIGSTPIGPTLVILYHLPPFLPQTDNTPHLVFIGYCQAQFQLEIVIAIELS